MYTVRDASSDDLPALERVDRLLEDHSHGDAVSRAVAEGRVVVGEGDEGVVGYVLWGYFWDMIPMSIMARVLAPHRRHGLGRDLYEAVERDLRRRGHTFWLSSTEETDEDSRRFHEALGFRPIGKLAELGQDVPEIFYRKDIH